MRFAPERVTFLRANRGLNRKEFATLTGLRPETITRIEKGQWVPKRATQVIFARVLRCEPEAFYTLDESAA